MKRWIGFVLIIAAVASVVLYLFLFRTSKIPPGVIVGSGRIEGDDIELSSKIPGKIVKLFVDEGDSVKKGEVVALLESDEYEARLKQARAALDVAMMKCEAAKYDWLLTRKSVNIDIEKAEKSFEVSRYRMLQAKADYEKALSDFKRFEKLYRKRVISKSRFEEVKRAYEVSKERYRAALKAVEIAKNNLSLAKEKLNLVRSKKKIYEAMLNEVRRAKAGVEEALAFLNDTRIVSPIDGVVLEKLVDVGEVISAGTAIFVVVDLNKLYLKMFINEKDIGKIALGMPARIYVDAYPKRAFEAYVCFVSQKAEFTPKEVETVSERIHHVFAVKLCLKRNPKGLLKPGMPANGVIKYAGNVWYNPLTGEVQ